MQADAWMRGVELLRAAVPEFGTPGDRGAFRTVMFRIHVDSLTGREAHSK